MNGTIIFDLEGTLVDAGDSAVSNVFIEEAQLATTANLYTTGIVTGATREELTYVLAHTFLGKYFKAQYTVTVDECAEPKATGKPFQVLLEKGVPKPFVILGDSYGDRLGAEALGIPFVFVDTIRLLSGEGLGNYISEALKKLSQ